MEGIGMKTDWANRIGVHILTRNRHNYLAALLSSLLTQSHRNWDLYILDNNDDGNEIGRNHLIVSLVKKMTFCKHKVGIVRSDPTLRKNIGKSRNILIDADENKWCCRIDDDSILNTNYLFRLWQVVRNMPNENIGAVGGVVPTLFLPQMYKYPPKIFNKIVRTTVPETYIELSKKYPDVEGFKDENEIYYNIGEPIDDGAYCYAPGDNIIPSHHLRSSFLFNREALIAVGGHPSSDDTGFREETITSIKLLEKGYKLYTNTQAVAWHLFAPNLGRGYTKEYTTEDHQKKILKNEVTFQRDYREVMRKLFG